MAQVEAKEDATRHNVASCACEKGEEWQIPSGLVSTMVLSEAKEDAITYNELDLETSSYCSKDEPVVALGTMTEDNVAPAPKLQTNMQPRRYSNFDAIYVVASSKEFLANGFRFARIARPIVGNNLLRKMMKMNTKLSVVLSWNMTYDNYVIVPLLSCPITIYQ